MTDFMDDNFDVLKNGVRFECQGSGKCCVSRGQYGFVYLHKKDRQRLAGFLGMNTSAFTKKYCTKTDGFYHLKSDHEGGECRFLKDKRCEIYEARPVQCRTWPFWPEVMNAKSWQAEVSSFCPGIGKGKFHSPQEIRETIEWQKSLEINP